MLIQQHGKPVYHESFGVQDVASKAPITDETIFRLFSMTKAITSVVAMMLVEDGKIKLDDPVSKYIPSFANVKVGVEKKAEDGSKTLELVPLERPITILDLMRHTSGITYGFYGDSLVRKAYAGADLYAGDFDLAEFAERIAKLPLHESAGNALAITAIPPTSSARVMEIASGKSLLELEKEKLLDPLGMNDTTFYVTDPEKKKLLAQPVPNDSDFRVGSREPPRHAQEMGIRQRRHGLDHGGLLRALRRCCSMAARSEGKQYLSPKTFELMTTDQVGKGSGVERDYFYFPGDGFGFGLGLRCVPIPATRNRRRRAARRIEMGRRLRLLFRDRSQAGHVLRAAGTDADASASASSGR